MKIDFDVEASELTSELKSADGYLDCEEIILSNIKKHIAREIPTQDIQSYLKKLQIFFEDKMVINKGSEVAVNYKYGAGFLNTINITPYWHGWMNTKNTKH